MSNRLISICFFVGFIVLAFGSTDDLDPAGLESDYSNSYNNDQSETEKKEPAPAPAPKKKKLKKKKPKKPKAQDMR